MGLAKFEKGLTMKEDQGTGSNTIVVESLDGEGWYGETHEAVVVMMRQTAWGGEESDGIKGYMKQVAKRLWDWSQREIRIDSAEHFLADMESAGVVRVRTRK